MSKYKAFNHQPLGVAAHLHLKIIRHIICIIYMYIYNNNIYNTIYILYYIHIYIYRIIHSYLCIYTYVGIYIYSFVYLIIVFGNPAFDIHFPHLQLVSISRKKPPAVIAQYSQEQLLTETMEWPSPPRNATTRIMHSHTKRNFIQGWQL